MTRKIHPAKLPLITLALGGAGTALRFWHFATANEAGLLESGHPASILVGLLTIVTVAGLFIFTRPLKGHGKYRNNFPASLPSAVCCWAAALALFLCAISQLLEGLSPATVLGGILGVAAAPCFVLAGMCRLKGQRTSFLLHMVICLALTFQLILHYQVFSGYSVLHLYIFRMLALIGLALTAYHRAEFDVRLGRRRTYTFISLSTVFCCLLAIPEGDSLFFLVMAAWVCTNLCDLGISHPRPPHAAEETPAVPEWAPWEES